MIIVVLKNPVPEDPARKNSDLEVRMMIQGITLDEADTLGDAIHDFAVKMNRRHTLSAFELNNEIARN
jgi:hypothetical protein